MLLNVLLPCVMQANESELVLYYRNMEDESLLQAARTRNDLSETAQDVLKRELASRHLSLPTLEDDAEEEAPDEKIVTLRTFMDFLEAMAARAALESADIPCFLRDENFLRNAWHLSGFAGYSRLDVRQQDVEAAEQALAPIDSKESDFLSEDDKESQVDNDRE